MGNKVSLKDIAQKVGVSTALVSYVLNNQKEGRIGKEVAQKIRDTARRLNYRPNQIARSLKTQKTFTIGLVVADIANPFFSSLARIIEDRAAKSNYTVIFGSSDEKSERSQKLIDVFVDRQVDGMIISPTEGSEQQVKQLIKQGLPFVLIDRFFPGIKSRYVVVDNYQAAYKAGAHLVQAGRKRIGMIGFRSSLLSLTDRKEGFLQALSDCGIRSLKDDVQEVSLDASRTEVEAAIRRLLSLPKPVDALFFASNKLSTYGLKYINQMALEVPKDLAICSFDESDATDLFYAPLTHVRQPLQQLGEAAVDLLLEAMAGNEPLRHVQLETEFVTGKSTRIKD